MELFGYFAAILIGVSLGLIGGGGSILTVPVMVYLFGINPLLATSYSLFIVGSTSLVGAISNYRKGLVNVKTAFYFGSASIITVFATRKFLIPLIPETVTINEVAVPWSLITMVLFSILMLLASVSMIKSPTLEASDKECTECIKFFKLLGYGIAIGILTGILGAGGGFLLIPALVFLVKLPMKKAIGTSLMIISLNSLIGFTGDLGHTLIDWKFLLVITLIAMGGVLIGGVIGKKVEGEKLRKGFGWFVLAMGIYILYREML
ncbi:MAG: sulfite exporter TauE/SafE family protein [Daejeonella sp.]